MSFLTALFDQKKIYNFEHAFNARDITTTAMQEAIKDWARLYYQTMPTKEEDPCQRIPATIVSKLTKTVFSEYVAVPAKRSNGSEYAVAILAALEHRRKKAMQQALIGGRCFLKPVFGAQGLTFTVIPRGCYIPLGMDEQDNITDIGTAERTVLGRTYFTLLERRTVDAAGYLTIQNKLYMSDNDNVLGQEVSLASLEKYAALVPEYTYPVPVYSLGLIPVQTPMENCVDGSPEPVAVYAPAVGLIHNINKNEALLNGEFERGQSRVIVPETMMQRGKDGRRGLTDNVFAAAPMLDSENITIFSPELREASFLARKAEYLRNVENIIGLKRGLLSEVEAQERTATEITSSAGDYNLTITDFQEMWEGAVREAVRVCTLLGRLYQVYNGPDIDPEKDIAISWGNGILYDEDQVWADLKGMVAAGIFYPELEKMPREAYQEAIERCFWFINCGNEEQNQRPAPKLVDWEQDFRYIVAPINRVLGAEVRSVEYLHWWTFISAYYEIGECLFAQIVRIRSLRAKGKPLDRADAEWYRENRALVDLKTTYSEAEDAVMGVWIGKKG